MAMQTDQKQDHAYFPEHRNDWIPCIYIESKAPEECPIMNNKQ